MDLIINEDVISILSYDILGLIYYINKVQEGDLKKNIFNKKSYVGEVGEFSFENKIVTYKQYTMLN